MRRRKTVIRWCHISCIRVTRTVPPPICRLLTSIFYYFSYTHFDMFSLWLVKYVIIQLMS